MNLRGRDSAEVRPAAITPETNGRVESTNWTELRLGFKTVVTFSTTGMWVYNHSAKYIALKNSLIIQEQNTKKNHKRVVVLYVIKNHVNLHKL
jgi:hypothetical protein